MPSRNLTFRRGLAEQDLESWPTVNSDALSEKETQSFIRRATAIRMYAQHASLKSIQEATGIDKKSLYRLADRCLATDTDGRIAGFRALVRYKHLADVRSDDPKKLVSRQPKPGCLCALFVRHPHIQTTLRDYAVLGKTGENKIREVDVPISSIHAKFLELCEKEGIQYPHYPFNSESEGKSAIRRWVAKQRLREGLEYLANKDPKAAASTYSLAADCETAEAVSRCYQRVECDGHKIDVHATVELPSPTGEGVIFKKISRIWIIVLIEVMSRAIIGYAFSFGANYSSVDIGRALRNSMTPWTPRRLTLQSVSYREGDGLPNGVIDGLSYARFDELWIDNAKAHLSRFFLNYLQRLVGAVPVFGPFGTPNARPFVEGFFNVLEEAGLHRMVGTSGSSPKDPRGKKQNYGVEQYLTFEMLADVIDILISRINGSRAPDSSISRLDVLRRVVTRRTAIIRRIPSSDRQDLVRYDLQMECTISKDHNRVCVRFVGARYYNEVLASAYLLVGKRVMISADSDDLRRVECFLEDGSSIGKLIVEKRWRETRHSLTTRREIIRLQNKGSALSGEDLPRAWRKECERQAQKSKRAAARLARLRIEQNATLNPTAPQCDVVNDSSVESETLGPQSSRLVSEEDHESYSDAEARLGNLRTIYRR